MTEAGARVPIEVGDAKLTALLDTGATLSSLDIGLSRSHISPETMLFVGFSGTPQVLHKTHPLLVTLAGQTSQHQFVHSVQIPVNLLGRDILVITGASILCCADGLRLTFPNGQTLKATSDGGTLGSYLMTPLSEPMADIYWAKLDPETPEAVGVFQSFLQWKPWILTLRPYLPPIDELPCSPFLGQA